MGRTGNAARARPSGQRETLRQRNIKCAFLLTEELRQREPQRGSRWHLDEMHIQVDGVNYWLWQAINEGGAVLDILLQ